jgi:cholesterol transport system auxiliary component
MRSGLRPATMAGPMTEATVSRLAGSLAALAFAFVVAGCSLTRPAPVKNTFLLDPPPPPAVATPKPGTLRIGAFNVSAPYRDRAFTYRTGDVKYESDFYNEFFVAPGPMIGQATSKALANAKPFTRVVPAGTAPEEGDFVLEGFVSDLYADTREKPAAGVVGVNFYLTRTTFPPAVVWSREYRERVPLAASTPEALANAWNEALGRVLAKLAEDLAAVSLDGPPSR